MFFGPIEKGVLILGIICVVGALAQGLSNNTSSNSTVERPVTNNTTPAKPVVTETEKEVPMETVTDEQPIPTETTTSVSLDGRYNEQEAAKPDKTVDDSTIEEVTETVDNPAPVETPAQVETPTAQVTETKESKPCVIYSNVDKNGYVFVGKQYAGKSSKVEIKI